MQTHHWPAQQRVHAGIGALETALPKELDAFGWQRPLLITTNSLIRSGMAAIDAGAKGPGARQRGPRLPPAVPAELGQALTSNPAAKRFFNSLPPSAQREYTDWISEAKRAETRVRRLQQTIDQLTQGRRRYEKPGEAD
mgnify:CR=1 FL=1